MKSDSLFAILSAAVGDLTGMKRAGDTLRRMWKLRHRVTESWGSLLSTFWFCGVPGPPTRLGAPLEEDEVEDDYIEGADHVATVSFAGTANSVQSH